MSQIGDTRMNARTLPSARPAMTVMTVKTARTKPPTSPSSVPASPVSDGHRLRQTGATDFVVFEKAASVGGTWRDNHYPGCACDVQSHVYSFSFAPNPRWTRMFAPQPEIRAYLEDCVQRSASVRICE
jgi:hypothetical protein